MARSGSFGKDHFIDLRYNLSNTSKGGSRRREKNHKFLLMMMRAFAPSAATAFGASTTIGLGRGLVVNKRIAVTISNSFYVIFYPIVVHIPNFIQIGQKT